MRSTSSTLSVSTRSSASRARIASDVTSLDGPHWRPEPRDVKRYATAVGARGVSANTVRLALAPVKALLATAVEDGLIRSNPAAAERARELHATGLSCPKVPAELDVPLATAKSWLWPRDQLARDGS
jgi:hypothetical protein